jgi:imidazolonepropionase-like amidohydrolase
VPITFAGASVIDGLGGDPIASSAVSLEGDRIVGVGRLASGGHDHELVDVTGLTILPGLIDAHTHLGIAYELSNNVAGAVSAAEIAAGVFHNLELALDAGFTTCRDMGGLDGGVADAVARGLIHGPRILPSGPALAQDGGHGTFMAAYSDCHCSTSIPGMVDGVLVVNGVEEVRLGARKAFRRGATQLKVFTSGGVISLTDEIDHTQFTVEELRAAVMEADARGTYVTAHAHNVRAIRNGLEAGIRCFEHGSWLDEETAELMAIAGAALVPTFTVAALMRTEWEKWGLPEAVIPRMEQVEGRMAEAVQLARAAGVRLGSGSDLLGPNQVHRGLELVIRSRLTDPMDAIVAATSTNAKVLQRDDLGAIEVGRRADLIVVDGDPLADPKVLDDPDRVVLVVKDGRIVKNLVA